MPSLAVLNTEQVLIYLLILLPISERSSLSLGRSPYGFLYNCVAKSKYGLNQKWNILLDLVARHRLNATFEKLEGVA